MTCVSEKENCREVWEDIRVTQAIFEGLTSRIHVTAASFCSTWKTDGRRRRRTWKVFQKTCKAADRTGQWQHGRTTQIRTKVYRVFCASGELSTRKKAKATLSLRLTKHYIIKTYGKVEEYEDVSISFRDDPITK